MVSRGQGLDTAPGNEGLAEAGEEGQDADQVSSRHSWPAPAGHRRVSNRKTRPLAQEVSGT